MAEGGEDSDARLIAAAASGDRDAFGALLRRHYDRIHGLAWQLTGSRADADDIAQDVCCTLVEKIASFRGEAKFTHLAVRHRLQCLPRPAPPPPVVPRASPSGSRCWPAWRAAPDGRDLYDAIWLKSAIARLKPAYRDAAVLVAGQQLSHAEAAEILGVAEATDLVADARGAADARRRARPAMTARLKKFSQALPRISRRSASQ